MIDKTDLKGYSTSLQFSPEVFSAALAVTHKPTIGKGKRRSWGIGRHADKSSIVGIPDF